MNNLLKKVIIGLVTASLSCGAIYGGLISYRSVNAATVKVYNAGTIASQSYFFDDSSNTSYGTVSSDRMQSVFLTSTMTVTEMLVETGDTVQKGDVLFTYDTTLSEIQVEKAETDLQEQQLSLERMTEDLEKLKKLSPSSGSSDYSDAGYDDSGEEDDTSAEEEDETDTSIYSSESTPQLISEGADGSIDQPYVYLWSTSDPLTQRVLLQMFAPGQTIAYSDSVSDETVISTGETTDTDTPEDPTTGSIASSEDTTGSSSSGSSQIVYDDSEYADDDGYEEDDDTTVEYQDVTQSSSGSNTTYEDAGDDTEYTDDDEQPDATLGLIIRAAVPRFSENAEETGSAVVEEDTTDTSASGISVDTLPSEVYVVLEIHAFNNREATLKQQYGLHLYRVGEQVSVTLYNPEELIQTEPEEAEPSDSEAESVSDDSYYSSYDSGYDSSSDSTDSSTSDSLSSIGIYRSDIDWTASYTAKEIAEMIEQKETDVRDLTITVKKAEISLKEMKAELTDGSVKARFDGEIKTVRDPDDAQNSGSAVVVVSGGGGYYVTFSLGELDLEQVTVGSQVEISSYETGMIYVGTIRSVSDYPSTSSDYYFYGSGNTLVSYYPAQVQVEDDAEMKDGDFVSVEYNTGEDALTGLYLDKMFVRSEDGQRYVYVRDEDGILRKRTVATGKILMDSYIQIRSGITSDDWIAFPYGTDVKDGAKTSEADYSELYD